MLASIKLKAFEIASVFESSYDKENQCPFYLETYCWGVCHITPRTACSISWISENLPGIWVCAYKLGFKTGSQLHPLHTVRLHAKLLQKYFSSPLIHWGRVKYCRFLDKILDEKNIQRLRLIVKRILKE